MSPDIGKWIKMIGEAGIGWVTLNRLRTVLPMLIMQSDKMAASFKKATGHLAEIKAFEEVIRNEVEIRNSTRRTLIEKIVDASAEDRIEIEQKLEWLDGVTRQLNISLKALSYGDEGCVSEPIQETKIVEDHWIDRFNELARKRNEPWRTELLARILAKETAVPGSISARALWLVGTLEKSIFDAFSAVLDVCVWFASIPDPGPFVPDAHVIALNQPTEMTVRGHIAYVGELHQALEDVGLVSNTITSRKTIHGGSEFIVRYGDKGFRIKLNYELSIKGVLLTELGNSLASFHKPKWNAKGRLVFEGWIGSIPRRFAEITPEDVSDEALASDG